MNSFTDKLKDFIKDKEYVTFYTSFGFRDGDAWKIPMRIWVYEPRFLAGGLLSLITNAFGSIDDKEKENFKYRMAAVVADSESREKVIFQFDNDADAEEWRILDDNGKPAKTNLNGLVEGFINLPLDKAEKLLAAQNSSNGWLNFKATSKGHSGSGRLQLIAPEGLSVISDIDDTIKITELPAGNRIVIRNAFFKDYVAAPGMAESYNALANASFHYVSGSPWQLFEPLSDFLHGVDFPFGTYHMKSVPTNILSSETWEDLGKLAGGDATVDQKLEQISEIIHYFPKRRFMLVGDSGQHDPEVYRQIRSQFSEQIEEIRIRDVVNARELTPERLEGMTIIEAETIVEGVSNLG